jgi:hypothetical protein
MFVWAFCPGGGETTWMWLKVSRLARRAGEIGKDQAIR